MKFAPAFSPDGSRLAYTIVEGKRFDTKVVSVLGGESHVLLAYAGGLSWLGPDQLLFSHVSNGLHMGIVRATRTGDHLQDLYFSEHEAGMAHYSFAPRQVGPAGSCTAAAWSPDGSSMYFTVSVKGASHLWRQGYPYGDPRQITTGPTEEGVVAEPGGRSVLTALGTRESSLWIPQANSDRILVNEGELLGWRLEEESPPSFSPDGKFIYYLARQQTGAPPELWRVEVSSAKKEAVFPGVSMQNYDLSPDGKEILYTEKLSPGITELSIATLDRGAPVLRIPVSGVFIPRFGPRDKILVLRTEGNSNYLEQMNRDGSGLRRVIAQPIVDELCFSPLRDWVVTGVAVHGAPPLIAAFSLGGDDPPREFCSEPPCYPVWSTDGKWLLLGVEKGSGGNPARSLAIPIAPGKTLPDLPAGGILPDTDPKALPGSFYINHQGFIRGSSPSRYAYLDNGVHRNIYRVTLP